MKIATIVFLFCVAAVLAAPTESGEDVTEQNNQESGKDAEKIPTDQRQGRNENFDRKSGKITGQSNGNALSGSNSGYSGSQNGLSSPQSNFGGRGHNPPQGGIEYSGDSNNGQQGNGRGPGQFGQSGGQGQNGRPNSGSSGSQFGQSGNNFGGQGQNGRPTSGSSGSQFGQSGNNNGGQGPNSGSSGSQFGQSGNNFGGQGQNGRPTSGSSGSQFGQSGNNHGGQGPNGNNKPDQQGGSQFGPNAGFTTPNPYGKEQGESNESTESTDEPKTGVTYVKKEGDNKGSQSGASAGTGHVGSGDNRPTTRSPGFFDRLTGAFKKLG